MKRMELPPICIKCLVDKTITGYTEDASVEKKREYMLTVLKILGNAKPGESSPQLHKQIMRLQRDMFGKEQKDFSAIKFHFNDMMMELEPEMTAVVQAAKDPLYRAMQYAMTGNFIDFAAMSSVSEDKLRELLNKSEEVDLDLEEYAILKRDLAGAKNLVYLTDNCGEIVLDMVLMKQLKKAYPDLNVTAIVRGLPIVNDATMDDVKQIGLDQIVECMGNGNDIGGTVMELLSDEAKEKLEQADVIIAKGQGNFETLHGCELNVFFLFMCKCRNFTDMFGVNLYDGILANEMRLMIER